MQEQQWLLYVGENSMGNGEWIVASQTKAKGQAKGELSTPFQDPSLTKVLNRRLSHLAFYVKKQAITGYIGL